VPADSSQDTGKQAHYALLRQRLVLPALEGACLPRLRRRQAEPPPLRDLAARLGLSEKQAANHLLTARRAFQRLLEEEVRSYAGSEEEVWCWRRRRTRPIWRLPRSAR
jgi:hypothetical protein